MSPLLLCISYHTYCTNVRAYVKWLILVVVLVLHLSIMCNPEESVEAKSFPFLKVRGWSYSIRTIHDSTKVDNFFWGHFVCCKKTPCKKHPKEFFYNTKL